MRVADFLASCDGKWSPAPPASPGAVAAMARDSGLSLPPDYLEFLAQCNGGDGFLSVQPCYLRLWRVEDVVVNNRNYQMRQYVPGFFGFGDAGGGEFFAFDTRRPQPWPVVSIPFVPMEECSAWAVAGSFAELLERVAAQKAQDPEQGAAVDGAGM
jgi:hypothetical protein